MENPQSLQPEESVSTSALKVAMCETDEDDDAELDTMTDTIRIVDLDIINEQIAETAVQKMYKRFDHLCGRVYDVTIDGTVFNIGAYAWTGYQRYIIQLAKEMELETTGEELEGEPVFVSPFGFTTWTGQNLVDTGKLQIAYNDSMQIIEKEALDFASRMVNNYNQRGNETFSSMAEYLSYGDLMTWPQLSSREYYTNKGIELEFQDLAMAPQANLISNNGMESHVFSMQLSLTTSMGKGATCSRGKLAACTLVIGVSTADLQLNATVHNIKQIDRKLEISYNVNGIQHTIHSDYVVIAAPLEKTGIHFENFELPIDPPARQWHESYSYIIIADGMNPNFFNVSAEWDEPNFVTGSPSFPEVGEFLYCYLSAIINGSKYYSLATGYDVTEQLDLLLINPKLKFVHHWEYSHAVLKPQNPDQYQEILLAPSLYNIGAVEGLMSQMEGSIILARDIALLIANTHNISNVLISSMTTLMSHKTFGSKWIKLPY
uniref:Uncharacterized protein LOC102805603 n=1 Tax=Saccoglossus kowalevskii TaxID=10224 RepID=A0ABM0MXW1_SACKO|nr:PREDICTED: uncharacterized protein LOC102805603 [Saccoglossus kowalevskii]